ncbi:MAG: AMP-dependent synthetase [Alphaproteobacteria bacterium]|nr:MAG: AMP-dependent synthetase [Alphaproteobacteria bacterium]
MTASTPILTFGRLLDNAAKTWPDRDAIIFPERRQTFAELYQQADHRARQLIGLGVQPGDHVGILLPTGMEFVEVMFGIWLAGAIMVPINARYRSNEIAYLTENADLVTIVTTGDVAEGLNFVNRLYEGLPGVSDAADPWALSIEGAPKLRNIVMLGEGTAPGIVAEADALGTTGNIAPSDIETRRDAVVGDDIAMILYTSGTTSNPKGCLISGAALIQNGRALAEVYEMTGDDSFWSPLPMFHIAATFPMAACFDIGCAYITMGFFEPAAALKLLADTKATITYPCFITIISDMVNHPDWETADLSHARVMNISPGLQPAALIEKIEAKMPDCIMVGTFGLSEAAGSVCSHKVSDSRDVRHGRLGGPLPGQEVRIIHPETGEDQPVLEQGEILVRGPNILKGYYKDPVKTAEAIDSDGWLHTGDTGSLDENNQIMFHGRIKDMLKVGGENVAAAEIESLLQEHDAVKMAQIVSAPHERLVEVPAAFIELEDGASATEEELIAFCKGKISSFKIPRYVRFVDEWPMSTSKIQKYKLRDQIAAEIR